MKHLYSVSLILLLSIFAIFHCLTAQVTIEGTVSFSVLNLPLPNSEVYITTEDGGVDTTLVSDFAGTFQLKTDLVPGEVVHFLYTDICYGFETVLTVAAAEEVMTVGIRHCIQDRADCEAFFIWHPLDEDKAIQFLDLSAGEVQSWSWNFGDGKMSEESNPIHHFEKPGIYQVTLQILRGDTCNSSFSQEVWVDSFPCYCPEYAFPVCALNDVGERISFDNPCFAACAGFDVLVGCEDTCGCDSVYDPICIQAPFGAITFQNACEAICAGFALADTCRPVCVCPDIWDPVCVDLPDGTVKQFANDCEAQCAGFSDYYPCDPDTTCICSANYDPVCAIGFEGEIKTFNNECEANCAGYFITFTCDTSCFCYDEHDPVCVLLPRLGWIVQLQNKCIADCLELDIVPCDECVCPEIYDPVCVIADNGDIIQFDNYCLAQCAGYDAMIPCEGDCYCDHIYDPVCVIQDDGSVERYQSACQAFCEGYDVVYNCDNICDCPQTFAPVCVLLADGSYKEFTNECFAECYGYTDIVVCPSFKNDENGFPGLRNPKDLAASKIFPNPVKSILNLSITFSEEPQSYEIHLMDIQGKRVKSFATSAVQKQIISISLDGVVEGMYYLVIHGPEVNDVHKVVKIE